jgi:hypothetical protein
VILPDLNMIVLLSSAMLAGAALRGFGSRMSMAWGNSRQPEKPSLRTSMAHHKARPKKRVMPPAFVAHYVLDSLRYDDSENYPVLPGDLDDFIDAWCDENEVERVPKSTVREIIALSPEVTKIRTRLNLNNPAHRFVRDRQKVRQDKRGEPLNDRPIIYIMANVPATEPACPASDRTKDNSRPTPARPDRTRARTADVHVSGRVSERERRIA